MGEGPLGVTCQYVAIMACHSPLEIFFTNHGFPSPSLHSSFSYSLLTHSGASAPIDVDALPPPRPDNLASGALFGQKYTHHDAASSSY